jgi:hypothetical protein
VFRVALDASIIYLLTFLLFFKVPPLTTLLSIIMILITLVNDPYDPPLS